MIPEEKQKNNEQQFVHMSILSNIHAQIKIRIYTAAAYIIRLLHSRHPDFVGTLIGETSNLAETLSFIFHVQMNT